MDALAHAVLVSGAATPGDTRLGQLAATPELLTTLLSESPATPTVTVLVLDQFEDLFSQADASQRLTFLSMLANIPPFPKTHTHFIATLRADYASELFPDAFLYALVTADSIGLRDMTREELREAIWAPLVWFNEQPGATNLKKAWQTALVNRFIDLTIGDPALLPLLRVTQESIWLRGHLTLESFGTLSDALEERAESIFAYSEAGNHVRRARTRSELVRGDPVRDALVHELTGPNARLLTVREDERDGQPVDVVDIIHETLLRQWPRLADAIQRERGRLQRRQRFELQVARWKLESESYVLQGIDLDEARELARKNDVSLSDAGARRLLERSVRYADRARQRRQLAIAGAAVGLAVVVLLAIAAIVAFILLQRESNVARSRQLAALAMSQSPVHFDLALLLSRQAELTEDTFEARDALFTARATEPSLLTVLRGLRGRVQDLAFSPDALRLASATCDESKPARCRAMLQDWDLTARRAIGPAIDSGVTAVGALAFSFDDDGVHVRDARSTRPTSDQLPGAPSSRRTVVASADGKTLAIEDTDRTIRVWNVDRGEVVSVWPSGDSDQLAMQGTFPVLSDDGNLVARSTCVQSTGQHACLGADLQVWNVQENQVAWRIPSASTYVCSLRFSPDGVSLAALVGESCQSIQVWDLRAEGGPRLTLPVVANAFVLSKDGATLATASCSEQDASDACLQSDLQVWSLPPAEDPPPQTGPDLGGSLGGDGSVLVTVEHLGRMETGLWNVSTRQPAATQVNVPALDAVLDPAGATWPPWHVRPISRTVRRPTRSSGTFARGQQSDLLCFAHPPTQARHWPGIQRAMRLQSPRLEPRTYSSGILAAGCALETCTQSRPCGSFSVRMARCSRQVRARRTNPTLRACGYRIVVHASTRSNVLVLFVNAGPRGAGLPERLGLVSGVRWVLLDPPEIPVKDLARP